MAHPALVRIWFKPLFKRYGMLTAFLVLSLSGLAHADTSPADRSYAERVVKAAYLYKFGSYVAWPERLFAKPDSPLKIGIIGDDDLAEELAKVVVDRTINGRPVAVHKIRSSVTAPPVHVLYIGGTKPQIIDILTALKGQPLLTVTETDHALELGSMINFVAVDGKLRFEIAPNAARTGELAVSPRLFPIAHKVAAAPR